MFRHIFPALSFSLLLLCPACAADDAPLGSVTLFAERTTKLPAKVGGKNPTRDVSSFASSFLVGGNGVMVALVEAQYTVKGTRVVDIVVRYIETEGLNWAGNTTEKNEAHWKHQSALQFRGWANHHVLTNPTAVIKGNKIYLLVLSNRRNNSLRNGNDWHFELTVGAITGQVGSKKIKWRSSNSLRSKLKQEIGNRHLSVFPGSSNSALLRSNGAILFSANAKNKEGKWGHAIMQLKDDEEQWEVSFVEDPAECRVFSLFEWKEKLIRMFFDCLTDNTYAKEYDEVNKEWKDADDRLFRFLGRKRTSRDFISVTIENKTALLFTGELTSHDDGTSTFPLCLTDSNRVDTRFTIETSYTNITSGGLLHTNGELFFMYQAANKEVVATVFIRLNQQLLNVKSVLTAWAENDANLSRPCSETAPKNASPDTFCVTPMPTDGLVGFLSNNSDDFYWSDEYLFIDASVNGTKVKNGHTFHGTGEGARWPVGETYLSKRYNFTKYGLTVMGTVTIHETPKGDDSLLTVYGVGSHERWGLWYKGGQWKVISPTGQEELATDLETQQEYRVALILQNNAISVYVNGKSRGSPLPMSQAGTKPFDIRHVYIAGYYRGNGVNMTVTNVFLYNRVLNQNELEDASRRIAPATPTDPDHG